MASELAEANGGRRGAMRAGLIITAVALFGLCAAPLPTAGVGP